MSRPRKNAGTQLTATIEYSRILRGYTDSDVARIMGTSEQTARRRRADNSAFTLRELERLAKKLGIRITVSPNGTTAEGV